jgi:hypothetical protein
MKMGYAHNYTTSMKLFVIMTTVQNVGVTVDKSNTDLEMRHKNKDIRNNTERLQICTILKYALRALPRIPCLFVAAFPA